MHGVSDGRGRLVPGRRHLEAELVVRVEDLDEGDAVRLAREKEHVAQARAVHADLGGMKFAPRHGEHARMDICMGLCWWHTAAPTRMCDWRAVLTWGPRHRHNRREIRAGLYRPRRLPAAAALHRTPARGTKWRRNRRR